LIQSQLTALDNPIVFDTIASNESDLVKPSKDELPNILVPKHAITELKNEKENGKKKLNLNILKLKKKIDKKENEPEFFEVVLSPNNYAIGKNIIESNFSHKYQVSIIAIRRNGITSNKKLDEIQLESGDTLLLLSKENFYKKFLNENDFSIIIRCNVPPSSNKNLTLKICGKSINLWW
jgi:hypothetical protein